MRTTGVTTTINYIMSKYSIFNQRHLKSSLYLGLLIIAVINLFSVLFLTHALKKHDRFAYIVNISGRQRMLAQMTMRHARELTVTIDLAERALLAKHLERDCGR